MMNRDNKSKLSPSGRHWYPLVTSKSRQNTYDESFANTTKPVTKNTNTRKYNGVIVSPNQGNNFF